MIRVSASLLFVLLLATACSTTPQTARFSEQERADLIVRYYSDDTSYLLKPSKMEGPFMSILDKNAVLKVAKQQSGRQLAVVILIHYNTESESEAVKHDWKNQLTQVGYQRVVFLRGLNGMRANGLAILASGA